MDRHPCLQVTGGRGGETAADGGRWISAIPFKRVIQREVQDPLALALLRGEFAEGDIVRLDACDGQMVFAKV